MKQRRAKAWRSRFAREIRRDEKRARGRHARWSYDGLMATNPLARVMRDEREAGMRAFQRSLGVYLYGKERP